MLQPQPRRMAVPMEAASARPSCRSCMARSSRRRNGAVLCPPAVSATRCGVMPAAWRDSVSRSRGACEVCDEAVSSAAFIRSGRGTRRIIRSSAPGTRRSPSAGPRQATASAEPAARWAAVRANRRRRAAGSSCGGQDDDVGLRQVVEVPAAAWRSAVGRVRGGVSSSGVIRIVSAPPVCRARARASAVAVVPTTAALRAMGVGRPPQ